MTVFYMKYNTGLKLHTPITAWKVPKHGVISGPYFPVFGLDTERYGVSPRIQFKYRQIRTRNNSVLGHISRSVFNYIIPTPMIIISGNPCTVDTLAKSSMCSITGDLIALPGPEKWIHFYIFLNLNPASGDGKAGSLPSRLTEVVLL